MRLLAALALAGLASAAPGQEIVADLSQNRVAIDARFDGSEIVVFGAIKPGPAELPDAPPLEVIVAVSGPLLPVVVRKKERVAGIWINREAVEIDAAPSLYKVATTGPLGEVLADVEDLRHSITVPQAIRAVDARAGTGEEDTRRFTDALIRIREREGMYGLQEGAVSLAEQALFSTTLALPANLVEGRYTARIFLTRGGIVIARFSRTLDVQKVGLERWIYTLAHERPLAYGLLSLTLAILAGWGASAVFRYIRS
jgi:uncharacterized protein (TIGR02186 family)